MRAQSMKWEDFKIAVQRIESFEEVREAKAMLEELLPRFLTTYKSKNNPSLSTEEGASFLNRLICLVERLYIDAATLRAEERQNIEHRFWLVFRNLCNLAADKGLTTIHENLRTSCEDVLGPHDELTIMITILLGSTYYRLGNTEGAVQLLQRARQAREQTKGQNHSDTVGIAKFLEQIENSSLEEDIVATFANFDLS